MCEYDVRLKRGFFRSDAPRAVRRELRPTPPLDQPDFLRATDIIFVLYFDD